ncbi:single-stranded DNA-binding protein [Limosilactobacillus fermentum]|uniref:single-stranded DNA-binding protein n=1 Tax=Limosilactobacillus fermentum TaxID=1613 RepID=UPI002019FAD7|nr:single-stranded DNA-binding protein [Limosilactobacillus fermentum]MCL3984978.1 single-stranded DNA-binding protein [Limosilactobacillus fermentum]
MINRVVLIGRLTKDLELRYTQSGVAVARFNLAVNRQFKDKQTGQREADFISCQIWRQGAENLANYTHKGSLIGVEGRITTSNYENKEGQRVYRTDVTVENFSLLEPRQNGNQFNYHDNQANNYQANQGYNPAQGQSAEPNTGQEPGMGGNTPLPF